VDRRALLMAMGAAAAGSGAMATPGYDDADAVYRALRTQPATPLKIAGGVIDVVFADGAPGVDRDRVLAWGRRSAIAISTYFGRYPVAHHGLLVIAEASARVGHATTFGFGGSATRIHVGVSADDGAFARDWVLVHEMTHTALPDLPRRALWLQEGNATYVEPIAQAQAGHLPIEDVWRQSLRGMPTGEPDPGDGGMDGTTAHGRLYWGGATFWLLAEVAIHDQSGGRKSLREALRAVNRKSGGDSSRWEPEQLMRVGDLATETHALSALYARFADSRVETDLPALFHRLGVMLRPDGGVAFDDGAPLAALRRSITQA
jgi:hypothetical protein